MMDIDFHEIWNLQAWQVIALIAASAILPRLIWKIVKSVPRICREFVRELIGSSLEDFAGSYKFSNAIKNAFNKDKDLGFGISYMCHVNDPTGKCWYQSREVRDVVHDMYSVLMQVQLQSKDGRKSLIQRVEELEDQLKPNEKLKAMIKEEESR